MTEQTEANDEVTTTEIPEDALMSMERVDVNDVCPSCGGSTTYAPTYRKRKCSSCGHRGTEVEFSAREVADCPDCGETNPSGFEGDNGKKGYRCKSCHGCYTSV